MDQLNRFLNSVKVRYDDDNVDRLNYYYTVVVLLAFAITLSAKQYVGQPIQCWVPAQFKGNWEQYTENYCYIENTYWQNIYKKIPRDPEVRKGKEISYYQWVPFVLAIQAALFYSPHLLWKLLNWQSGLNVRAIVSMSVDASQVGKDGKAEVIETIANHVHDSCGLQKTIGREVNPFMWFFGCGKAKGIYVTLLYLTVKLLFVINLVGQFFLLNAFIGSKYNFWGAEILTDLTQGRKWENSGHFPRVTLCDLQVRELGNMHRWTVQCVLMINMFNEKIYLFIWWWLLIVTVVTVVNFVWWLLQSFSRAKRVNFIKKYYQASKALEQMSLSDTGGPDTLTSRPVADLNSLRHFVRSRLRPDGVFVLRLVAANAGDVVTAEIVERLYAMYREDMDNGTRMLMESAEKKKMPVFNDSA